MLFHRASCTVKVLFGEVHGLKLKTLNASSNNTLFCDT